LKAVNWSIVIKTPFDKTVICKQFPHLSHIGKLSFVWWVDLVHEILHFMYHENENLEEIRAVVKALSLTFESFPTFEKAAPRFATKWALN